VLVAQQLAHRSMASLMSFGHVHGRALQVALARLVLFQVQHQRYQAAEALRLAGDGEQKALALGLL
jgi:hypothetical protein